MASHENKTRARACSRVLEASSHEGSLDIVLEPRKTSQPRKKQKIDVVGVTSQNVKMVGTCNIEECNESPARIEKTVTSLSLSQKLSPAPQPVRRGNKITYEIVCDSQTKKSRADSTPPRLIRNKGEVNAARHQYIDSLNHFYRTISRLKLPNALAEQFDFVEKVSSKG